MRLVLLSDTHTLHGRIDVPPGDVLIHAGDFSGHGTLDEVDTFMRWFALQPHKHKVVIAGNHDWAFQTKASEARRLVPPEIHYLQDRAAVVAGLRFYGMPWQPVFYDWAFNLPRNGWEMQQKCAQIPDDTQVLVTHGPPFGVLDKVGGGRCGCEVLAERLTKLSDLRLHVFGHIHEGAGSVERDGVTFVNAAICTRRYVPSNPVQVIDLPDP